MIAATTNERPVLIFMMRQINSLTLSPFPCPMILLTIEEVVAAKRPRDATDQSKNIPHDIGNSQSGLTMMFYQDIKNIASSIR